VVRLGEDVDVLEGVELAKVDVLKGARLADDVEGPADVVGCWPGVGVVDEVWRGLGVVVVTWKARYVLARVSHPYEEYGSAVPTVVSEYMRTVVQYGMLLGLEKGQRSRFLPELQ
jgi:hypothetical protein